MKIRNSETAGIISQFISVLLWCCSFAIKESSFCLTYWVHENVLGKGNSIETEGALIVAAVYAAVTFTAVVFLTASITHFIYKKGLFKCMIYQIYRYFAFWGLFPLTIVGMCWDIIWPFLPAKSTVFRLPIPAIDLVLELSDAFCETVLFLSVVLVVLSIVSFSYGILINSNIKLNRIFAALWLIYAYYIAYIISPYFEYGKWFLIFIAIAYLIELVLFAVCKMKQKMPLIPKYEIIVLSFDEFEGESKITVDDSKEYDFSIFMPKKKNEDD